MLQYSPEMKEATVQFALPAMDNCFLQDHVRHMASSLVSLTGIELLPGIDIDAADFAELVFHAPFVLVSHNTETDPIFNYANNSALELFEMNWEQFTSLPSRMSAEPDLREERERLMNQVRTRGFIDNYAGVRISSTGKRFRIQQAYVWNIFDTEKKIVGQAALFSLWTPLPPSMCP